MVEEEEVVSFETDREDVPPTLTRLLGLSSAFVVPNSGTCVVVVNEMVTCSGLGVCEKPVKTGLAGGGVKGWTEANLRLDGAGVWTSPGVEGAFEDVGEGWVPVEDETNLRVEVDEDEALRFCAGDCWRWLCLSWNSCRSNQKGVRDHHSDRSSLCDKEGGHSR